MWAGYLSQYSDSLRAGRSGDRMPAGSEFSVPVQTGAGVQPYSYIMGTGSLPEVKRPGRGVDHPPPSSAQLVHRLPFCAFVADYRVTSIFTFNFTVH
jgi:hypothetical protein